MTTEPRASRELSFWETVRLLLSVSRRRGAGRIARQQALLKHRSSTNVAGQLGALMFCAGMALLNGFAAYMVREAVVATQSAQLEQQGKVVIRSTFFYNVLQELVQAKTQAERDAAQKRLDDYVDYEARLRSDDLGGSRADIEKFLREAVRTRPASDFVGINDAQPGIVSLSTTGPLPMMFVSLILSGWFLMLVCQGEGLELDLQRKRYPVWEWLFSHPVKQSAVFLAEMLSPLAANPIYVTGPLFPGLVYGSIYGVEVGFAAAILIGVPVSLAAACVGKALEIGIMLRFPPRSRGALIGILSWLGYATIFVILFGVTMMPRIAAVASRFSQPVADAIPWSYFLVFIGLESDGSFSFLTGMVSCWVASIVLIVAGVCFSVWGAQRDLAGSAGQIKPASAAKQITGFRLFKRDPLYRKEILWFLRDRGAVVQAVLIPVTIAGFELFNLHVFLRDASDSWQALPGIAVIFGTYFLWILGPRSLASEGPALWLAQTWPRGLEDLLKAKARLWFLLATIMVFVLLAFAAIRTPGEAWKILLIGVGWVAFGRSMAAKSITLVSVNSSSGDPEPIPRGRKWAASLGMLTFAIGIFRQHWELAVVGIVYSWITAEAMWENFRARLPFLFDPWSEKVPRPPTLMHAMIAISALVEGAVVVTAVVIFLFDLAGGSIAVALAVGYALTAIIVSVITSSILRSRGVRPATIWCWRDQGTSKTNAPYWWSGDGRVTRNFFIAMSIGALSGLLLGLLANGYVMLLTRRSMFPETVRLMQQEMENAGGLRVSYAVIAVLFAPFAEEYLFRGLLFRALDRSWGVWWAVLGSAAFFAIYHPLYAWLPVGAVGVATALVFKKTGRLAPAVILHMVYNAVVIVWGM